MSKTKNFAEVIRRKLAANPDLTERVEAERFNANVSEQIYQSRLQAHLTQAQLAGLVGMHQSAIARLEDTQYAGHSLQTLEKIASALGKRVEVQFVPRSVVASRPTSKRETASRSEKGNKAAESAPRRSPAARK